MQSLRYVWLYTALAGCGTLGHVSINPAPGHPTPGAAMVPDLSPNQGADVYERQCQTEFQQATDRLTQLEKATGPKTLETVLTPLNELWIVLDASLNTAGLYRNVHPDANVRAVANRCEQSFSQLATNIGLSRPLYIAIKALDVKAADAVTQRYVANLLRDFRRAGVDKDDATRDRIREIKDQLVTIGQDFDKNIRDDVRYVEFESAHVLDGLPEDYIQSHPPSAEGKIKISTEYPDYIPFMTYAKDDAARLALYKVFRKRGYPNNEPVLKALLEKRFTLAQLLGYPNWASYVTEDKMIKTPQAADTFIQRINDLAKPRSDRDYSDLLRRLRQDHPQAQEVGDWQKTYIEELVRREKYHFDSQSVRPFFPFGRVRKGLFDITGAMFGLVYRKTDAPVWHPSVEAYEVLDTTGQILGRFYLDLHPRSHKYQHAAAFPIRSGVANIQLPEAALVCNFPAGEDALMEHDDVETFFHEFGHLLHHILAGKQPWIGISGISTEWDFVEAPSQMLEEWTYDASTLKSFARNAQGEVINDNLIDAMSRARDFGKGLWVRHQLFYAALSLRFYNREPALMDLQTTVEDLQKRYSPFGYVPDTRFELSFGHLEGYSAIYYTYMWSLVIAKDMFSVFKQAGLLNPQVAARYRHEVLEPGGSQDAADLVRHFLGRDFTLDAFATWLNAE